MEKNNIQLSKTCVYNVNYHIVRSVKYRRKVFREIAEAKDFNLVLTEIGEQEVIFTVS